ncbi:isochorismate synthase [Antrihabitans cavernicola]|uniref:isochorismate synthase n=1 Tax=Antrihabitans cavernicola TaxID=2495913 RepID=A0A5A7S2K5_9NOCA|nr:isochorismate synthase [Spelaeibacter cavernicola]KAA0017387.1 isochorismate synthase [Spelaeibacter cavernicola]
MGGFLLAQSDRVLRTSGVRERFADVDAAAAAVRSGRIPLLVGAIAFDPSRPAALHAPESWDFDSAALPVGDLPEVRLVGQTPSPAEHVARVTRLVKLLGEGELRKVVAARSVQLAADAPIDPELLVAELVRRHPSSNGYAVELTGAGEQHDGAHLVGSSPELLVSKRGSTLTMRPLAGTAPRRPDPAADRDEADQLLASAKNREEHSYVIEWIRDQLSPVCSELTVPDGPALISTPEVWHLATSISAVLRDPATTALDVAVLLHPTPALCGTPTELAMKTITDIEGDRGFYGGAVGWCDERGDGDWIVAIRCAEVAADGRTATAYAGGGIVVASDPDAELDETTTKLRTLLGALNVTI